MTERAIYTERQPEVLCLSPHCDKQPQSPFVQMLPAMSSGVIPLPTARLESGEWKTPYVLGEDGPLVGTLSERQRLGYVRSASCAHSHPNYPPCVI